MINDLLKTLPEEKANPGFKIFITLVFDSKRAGYAPAAKLRMKSSSVSSIRIDELNSSAARNCFSERLLKKGNRRTELMIAMMIAIPIVKKDSPIN